MSVLPKKIKKKRRVHAVYPGSFDPITNGHLDILDRALKLFPEITLIVAGSGHKSALFSIDDRVEMLKEVVKNRQGVKVDRWNGLVMDYAKTHKVSAVIRGLRAASDFEYEFMMASMNKKLNSRVETLFMMTSQDLYFVSSSMIKELFKFGADISPYVPAVVTRKLSRKLAETGIES